MGRWCDASVTTDCEQAEDPDHTDCEGYRLYGCYLDKDHAEPQHWNPTLGNWSGGIQTDLTTRRPG